jgi:hypothetical protein
MNPIRIIYEYARLPVVHLRRLSSEETLVATFDLPTSASSLCSTVNEGVTVNYGKFGNLLAEVKAVTGK